MEHLRLVLDNLNVALCRVVEFGAGAVDHHRNTSGARELTAVAVLEQRTPHVELDVALLGRMVVVMQVCA